MYLSLASCCVQNVLFLSLCFFFLSPRCLCCLYIYKQTKYFYNKLSLQCACPSFNKRVPSTSVSLLVILPLEKRFLPQLTRNQISKFFANGTRRVGNMVFYLVFCAHLTSTIISGRIPGGADEPDKPKE